MPVASIVQRTPRDLDPEFSAGGRARDFVLMDCAVWLSNVVSAAQRNDPETVVDSCRSMRNTLQVLGAAATLNAAGQLAQECPFLSRKEMLRLSDLLLREVTTLVNLLIARRTCSESFEPEVGGFARDEAQTKPGRMGTARHP
jgi:hypothetical protein